MKWTLMRIMNNKVEGSFYTPAVLANFLVSEMLNYFVGKSSISILEPSCGDGAFLTALLNNKDSNEKIDSIYAVEKNKEELSKARSIERKLILKGITPAFIVSDFLEFEPTDSLKFDLVIGNPPYIHKKHLSSKQIDLSKNILYKSGIKKPVISNIWISFVVKAISMIKENGVLCYVLPAEMLQVKYAEDIRRLLFQKFDEISFLTFSEKIFADIEQDVIVLICKRNNNRKVINHGCITLKNNQCTLEYKNTVSKERYHDKWLWYLLKKEEVEIFTENLSKFNKIDDICHSGAGIVTGNNDYFIVSKSTVKKYKMQKYCKPILKKSFFVKDTVTFRENDFQAISDKDLPSYLLDFNNIKPNKIPKSVEQYLNIGEIEGVNKTYKCRIRSEWYKVPSIRHTEGIFFKRSHLYPKILYNEFGVYITDTGYRVQMKENYSMKDMVFCFYNSFTLLLSELDGRNYGGGVLEITPKEFKKLRVPYFNAGDSCFNQLQALFQSQVPFEKILEVTDEIILHKHWGISHETIQQIKNIRRMLMSNRLPNKYVNS